MTIPRRSATTRRSHAGASLLGGLALIACGQVLDIEEATVDPALDEAGAPAWGGAAGSGALVGEEGTLCARYCNLVMENCSDGFAVYTSGEACLAVCAELPEGRAGDEEGNSAECRITAAEKAPVEASFYCAIAGPGGNGVCGDNCEALCSIVSGVCTGENRQWPSTGACLDECAALPDRGTYTTAPEVRMHTGGDVQCRLLHATNAGLADPNLHCAHAAGEGPCQ
ncbi:MAG TPA: hypothetical protein VF989_01095 [Polyangiaceae bacterium]